MCHCCVQYHFTVFSGVPCKSLSVEELGKWFTEHLGLQEVAAILKGMWSKVKVVEAYLDVMSLTVIRHEYVYYMLHWDWKLLRFLQ